MQMEKAIRELCAEDDYGVWELWGRASTIPQLDPAERVELFCSIVERLVEEGSLIAKKRSKNGLEVVKLNPEELRAQVLAGKWEEIEGRYWFSDA